MINHWKFFFVLLSFLFPLTGQTTPLWLTPNSLFIPIETPAETGTALFQKNGIYYLVLNQKKIIPPDLPATDLISTFQEIPQSTNATVFAFRLNPKNQVALLKPHTNQWMLEITPSSSTPSLSFIKGKITSTQLILNTPLAAAPVWIDLPEQEEKILVIPFQNNTGGLPQSLDFLRLRLLKSHQGIALFPQTKLQIQYTPHQTQLIGSAPLASSTAFFPLFLPSADAADFKPQRTSLIRRASFASSEDQALFEQQLGILYLLNGQYQQAAIAFQKAPQTHPFWPALNALMRHQNQQAFLFLEKITDVPEITYLKNLLSGQKQALPTFLTQLPSQIQRPFLEMGIQNAFKAFDIPLAQTYLNAFQTLPPTPEQKQIHTWSNYWLRFLSGDKNQSPFLTQNATSLISFTKPLWNHLFENAEIYHLDDMETLAFFEEVRTFMEPNLTPRARQQLAAAYQRINLPQEAEKMMSFKK